MIQGGLFRLTSILLLLFFYAGGSGLAATHDENTHKAASIAFLPFAIHAPAAQKKFTYLREGVRDMLASRLAAKTGIKIIDKNLIDTSITTSAGRLTAEQIGTLAGKIGADYVMAGSLTFMGAGVSLDARVFPIHPLKKAAPVNFYASAGQDEIITAIDKLAGDVAEKLFGQKRSAIATPPAPASPPQTAHPDREFLQSTPGSSPFINPLIINPAGIRGGGQFIKSQNLELALQAMDVGDVNGDGREEVVLGDKTKVFVYRRNGNKLTILKQIAMPGRYRIHAINLADLNGDGKKEIYISAADNTRPNSSAVEWRDGKPVYLFRNLSWYIRPLAVPGQKTILAGQQAAANGPLSPGIYRLTITKNRVTAKQRLEIPAAVNLFNFSYADLDGDGQAEIVAVNRHDNLLVLRQNGKLLWKSADHFGGTTRFIGGKPLSKSSNTQKYVDEERIYVPTRIMTADVNNDGRTDIIVNKNLSTASRIFRNLKSYPNGELHCLTWNGIALSDLWQTKKIDGYIADYQLRRNKEGKDGKLYIGLVLRSGWGDLISSSESTVLIYDLATVE